jgi:hypothetical protein
MSDAVVVSLLPFLASDVTLAESLVFEESERLH